MLDGSDGQPEIIEVDFPAVGGPLDLDIVRTVDAGATGEGRGAFGAAEPAIVASADRRPQLPDRQPDAEPPVEQTIGAVSLGGAAPRDEYIESGRADTSEAGEALADDAGGPPVIPPETAGLAGEGGDDELAASEREAAAAWRSLEGTLDKYNCTQPERYRTREGHAVLSVARDDEAAIDAVYEALAPNGTVGATWHELPADPAETGALAPDADMHFYTETEHGPRFIAKTVAMPLDNVRVGELFQSDHELSMAPLVGQVIDTDAAQQAARAHGFSGITFTAPLAGFVNNKQGVETIVYPHHDGFAVIADHGSDTHRVEIVCNKLEVVFARHGIAAMLETGNLAQAPDGDGGTRLHLNCHQRNIFQVVPGFIPPPTATNT